MSWFLFNGSYCHCVRRESVAALVEQAVSDFAKSSLMRWYGAAGSDRKAPTASSRVSWYVESAVSRFLRSGCLPSS